MPALCPHCGVEHAENDRYCSATGRPVAAEPTSGGPWDEILAAPRGVLRLLLEALAIYRRHARAFLITAAVLLVPGSFISSCAVSAVMAPVMVDAPSTHEVAERLASRTQDLSRRLEEVARNGDPELARRSGEDAHQLREQAERLARLTLGSTGAAVLALAGWAIIALVLYGLVLPLTHGAITVAVADRILGGNATWREHWMLLFRRLGLLLSALVPAALLVMLGYFCLVIPGLVLSFCFAFVAPVVLIEGIGGAAALRRSYALVRADWLRTALMLISFGLLNTAAHWLVGLFLPRSAVFFGSFLGDLLMMVVMPVPIIAAVLLYFQLRREVDGLTDDRLKAELEALR
jgi:hypothetical protein